MRSVLERVTECIASTTRYPQQLLTPDADLEDDLGIDSVKRVEIVAAIAEEFSFDMTAHERDPAVRTIAQVAEWVDRISTPAGHHAPVTRMDAAADSAPVPSVPKPIAEITQANCNVHAQNAGNPTPNEATRTKNDHNGHSARLDAAHPRAFAPHHGGRGGEVQSPIFPPQNQAPFASHPQSTRGSAVAPVGPRTQPELPTATNRLDGRVALVTGSGRGVGKTIARLLAAHGATVVINSFHSRDLGEQTAAEINAAGGSALHLWGSVTNSQQVDSIFEQLEQQIGYLDILVCNASDGRLGEFTEISPQDWDRAFQTNVSGHYHCAMRAHPLMQRRGGGSIVTMSSVAAHRHVQGMGGQGVVKAAVESMTRYLACELAPLGIRTNCVSGGPVYGDVMAQYPEASATFNYWESIVPDGELCSPLDLANTVAFLVSDAARSVNGAVWTVDHGASTRAHSRPLPRAAQPLDAITN